MAEETELLQSDNSDCPDNKFKYSFDHPGATITTFVVERFHKDLPPESGAFSVCIFDPNDPPQIRVTVVGRKDAPAGRASLTLNFNGKDVYSPARELDDKGHGLLGFTELVNLPV